MDKRPTINSFEVIKETVKKLLPLINEWLDIEDDNGLLPDIERAIASTNDGYEIARILQQESGIVPDSELVMIFEDNTLSFKLDCLEELSKKWIADNKITQSRNVGDAVIYNGNKAIIKQITYDGKYVLFIAAMGHVESENGTTGIYVNWENVSDE